MKLLLMACLAVAAVTVTGCTDEHAGMVCTHETQVYNPPIYIKVGNVMVPSGGGWSQECDSWAAPPSSSGTN